MKRSILYLASILAILTFAMPVWSLDIATIDSNPALIEVARERGWIAANATVMTKEDAENVTDIGQAFCNNKELTSFDEFSYFTSVEGINPNNDYNGAFRNCTNLKSIKLPSSLKTIGRYAFEGCESLEAIVIPNSVTTIGSNAFSHCSLTSLTIPDAVTRIEGSAFRGCKFTKVTIPKNVKTIDENPFTDCRSLKELWVDPKNQWFITPDNVLLNRSQTTLICYPCGKTATSYTIPSGVSTILSYAFAFNDNLRSISFPETLSTISSYAFFATSGISTINISKNVTNIHGAAFEKCTGITEFIVNDLNTKYASERGVLFSKDKKQLIAYPLGSSKQEYAIPDRVKTIDSYAFYNAKYLKSIDIPAGITEIGQMAFNIDNLTTVTARMTTPCPVMEDCFSNYTYKNGTLFVPQGRISAYRGTQGWNFNNIREIGGSAEDEDIITFADAEAKRICVENWDANGDGELSEQEAARVTDLGQVFNQNKTVKTFDELKYFTALKAVGENAFLMCTNLESITLPQGLRTIGGMAFFGCSRLEEITFPEGIETIGQYAFCRASSLEYVVFPASMKTIGHHAFGEVVLKEVTALMTTPCELGEEAFYNYLTCILYVPRGSKAAYSDFHSGWHFEDIREIGGSDDVFVDFADSETERICLRRWDANSDGKLSTAEAAAVTDLGTAFKGSSIKSFDEIEYFVNLTAISEGAFQGCSSLGTITIPRWITSIEKNAFRDCSLYAITIPKKTKRIDDGTFWGCSNLGSISLPVSVTSLGNGAFWGCSSLKSFTIHEGVTQIGESAFAGCTSMKRMISNILEPFAVEDNVFENTGKQEDGDATQEGLTHCLLFVPTGTKWKYEQTKGWRNFTKIVENDTIAFVDPEARQVCIDNWDKDGDGRLSKAEAHAIENVYGAFKGNTRLTSFDEFQYFTGLIDKPAHTDRSQGPFQDCTNLRRVTLPENLRTIDYNYFRDCQSLTNITIPESVTSIGDYAFTGSALTTVTIPKYVSSLGSSGDGIYCPFYNCRSLKEINVAEGNESFLSIDGVLFGGDMKNFICYPAGKDAKDYTIPDGVEILKELSLAYCNLTSITLPNSLNTIGGGAFEYVDKISRIVSLMPEPCKVLHGLGFTDNVFENATLIVPKGSKSAYKESMEWGRFKNIVEDIIGSDYTDDNGVTYTLRPGNKATLKEVTKGNQELAIPGTIECEGQTFTVDEIGSEAFSAMWLYSITIPSTITTISVNAFRKSKAASVIWKTRNVRLTESDVEKMREEVPNVLVYVDDSSQANNWGYWHSTAGMVVGNRAGLIELKDNSNFYCPRAFTADRISYTRNFSMDSGYGNSAGWESVALPFMPTTFSHEKGELTPFNAPSGGDLHFWLCKWTRNGWRLATEFAANEAFIVCLPNNENYEDHYNLKGDVTFSATSATVYKTPASRSGYTSSAYNNREFYPTFFRMDAESSVYAINATRKDSTDPTGGETPGSAFISKLREVRPFEGYIYAQGSNARMFPVLADSEGGVQVIAVIPTPTQQTQRSIYDTKGVLVKGQLAPGVYLVNGKKIVVK